MKVRQDPSTLSNYLEVELQHMLLETSIIFSEKRLTGQVTLSMEPRVVGKALEQIVLDTSFLDISNVYVDEQETAFCVKERKSFLGSALHIVPSAVLRKGKQFKLRIVYATTKDCTALQFLSPNQTIGKKHPYVFSQCQAIHARSMVPCQDTPSVKFPCTFRIRSPFPVIASGIPAGSQDFNNGSLVYVFEQRNKIPSYLISLLSGDLASCPVGPRSFVYTEPSNLMACKYEFEQDMERFIQAAESITFAYPWTRYDFVILPPSFPYGGMENPNATFATPTLIAGDRSNVNVIAHELAHSWSGNLVTNESWQTFWLNEGMTVFLERKIIGRIYGEKYRQFDAIIGWGELKEAVELFGPNHEFTKLVQNLDGVDPDDAFSTIPYEKGSSLLYHIETVLGGAHIFEPFLPYYFRKFSNSSVNELQFKETLYEFFKPQGLTGQLDKIDWQAWLYGPGMPPVTPNFDTTLANPCYTLAEKWRTAAEAHTAPVPFAADDVKRWSAGQSSLFLDLLFETSPLPNQYIETLSDVYAYGKSENAELLFRFYKLALKAKYTRLYDTIAQAVGSVGRMKFVRPIYRLLNSVDHDFAVKTFLKYRDFYHKICSSMVAKDLKLTE
ncbi:leukotriene A-4 hydrolase [Schizosaccharomyces japonicus yFS275]|uniref:Leukotriene A(4) hydrolase n=1 Tax=Schizosaccharomyces japonicus (strain yFS275 / FY16936) TaxID=402676 RepID=B6JXG1_SCHJY|nr:leukotriene A-4 hydrolase [Schizosaccharomyces japonicus yFS275]EEB06062.1 leukotriene A-4 hydrolase [Schizosaccharomyces japonicus yFS275]